MKLGYLIPEFPGQTHVWMWREICHMREWGDTIDVFSTRQPAPECRARHSFAQSAAAQTYYLWPKNPLYYLTTLSWAVLKHPKGFFRMLKHCFTLKLNDRHAWKTTLPLAIVATALAREALKHNIQHFHSHTCSNSAVLAMMVKRLTGIPFSMTLNANIEWWGGAMEQKFSDAEFTAVITEWLLAQIRSDYPELSVNKAFLGRIGVDTQKWRPNAGLSRLESGAFRVITVGRLHASKGHDTVIRAIKDMLERGRIVRLTIVGAGPEEQSLKALVHELGLTESVHLTGSLSEDQIIALMWQSDAFVLASHAEPLGVVYMEAMAVGVPTIGTDAGGVPEIISHSIDGLLVPPKDETAIREALELLMDDPALAKQLSLNARRTIVSRFDSRLGAAKLYERLHGVAPGAI